MTTTRPNRPLCAVALGAALCGSFDLIFAFVYYGLKFGSKPAGILRSVASGWMGGPASKVGMAPVYLGVFFHFAIATGIAAVFWLASRLFPVLLRRPAVSGLLYGAVVYCVMNWVIVPLSAAGMRGGFPKVDWIAFVGHMVLVGLPVALAVARFAPAAPPARRETPDAP